MTWRVVFNPGVEQDVAEAAAWYEGKRPGLGGEFIGEVIVVWRSLAENPLLAGPQASGQKPALALSVALPLPHHL